MVLLENAEFCLFHSKWKSVHCVFGLYPCRGWSIKTVSSVYCIVCHLSWDTVPWSRRKGEKTFTDCCPTCVEQKNFRLIVVVAVSFTWVVCSSTINIYHHIQYSRSSTTKHTAIHAQLLVGKLFTSTHWVATGEVLPHRIGSSFYFSGCQPRMTIESWERRAATSTMARTWIILYSQLGFWESGRWKICYKWKCLTNLKAPRDTKFTTLHTDYMTTIFLASIH